MTIDVAANQLKSKGKRNRVVLIAGVFVVLAVGLLVWTSTCPCNRVRGFILLGTVNSTPVTDWRFVNDVPLCQMQVSTGLGPYAINLNCMATPDGRLFVSCSRGDEKYWCKQVGPDARGRLRLDGVVYPIVLNRVTDQAVLDQVWDARVRKLQKYGGGPYNPVPAPDAKRPDNWWSFHAHS